MDNLVRCKCEPAGAHLLRVCRSWVNLDFMALFRTECVARRNLCTSWHRPRVWRYMHPDPTVLIDKNCLDFRR